MFTLNTLVPIVKKRKRIGRGGSRGSTSGKGHKGQKARTSGGIAIGFEGGQMPLYRRIPKRGFTNARFKRNVVIVNLEQIDRISTDGDIVTAQMLLEKRVIRPSKGRGYELKVLGEGTLSKKITVQAHAFSGSAKQAIEQAGGVAEYIQSI
jgi:large subunit ribosomal protein L15